MALLDKANTSRYGNPEITHVNIGTGTRPGILISGLDHDSQTEDTIDLRFLNDYIDSLAEEFPAQRKKIFILSKRQNYTNKEIAEMMGISESTVATQLSLAVKFMREQFMKHYDKVIALLIAFFVNEM